MKKIAKWLGKKDEAGEIHLSNWLNVEITIFLA